MYVFIYYHIFFYIHIDFSLQFRQETNYHFGFVIRLNTQIIYKLLNY